MLKKTILVVIFIIVYMGVMPHIASADFAEGRKAARKGKYDLAREKLLPLAKKGHPKAQHYIGVMYQRGKGFFKDKEEAKRWFLKSENGLRKLARDDPDAQTILGNMFYYGYGVEQDYEQAAELYKKAADTGFAWAQFRLGWLYRGGKGVPWDEKKAIKWYEKAARQGVALAANNIGVLYHNGETIEKDPIKALMWYNIAKSISKFADTTLNRRARKLATRNANKRTFTEEMFQGDIEKANRLANEWLEKHGK